MIKEFPINVNIPFEKIGFRFKINTIHLKYPDLIGNLIFIKEEIPINVPNPNPKSQSYNFSYKIYSNKIMQIDIRDKIKFNPKFIRFEIKIDNINFIHLELD